MAACLHQLGRAHRRQPYLEVDPVEQWTGEPAEVPTTSQRGTLTAVVAGRVRTRARIGGEDQLGAGGILGTAPATGEQYPAMLQRLTQRLKRRLAELRRLVHQQHPTVGQ
ncbi:hypothetical protein GCM10029963_30330 [Micromonospora andamanensis]